MKKILINLLLIFGASLLLGFVFLKIYLPTYTNHGETVSVPDLSGYTFDEAINILEKSGLNYEVSLDSGYSTDEKALAVLKQIPPASEQVKNGRKIYLTLNARNAPMIKLPNLVNMPLKNVQEILANLGLERGEIIYVPDIGINVVLEQQYRGQTVTEGFEIPKGEKIDLVVGDGLGNQILSVPNFVGMDEIDAEFLILGSGLRMGEKVYFRNDTIPPGHVFRQAPPAETQVKTGEMIDLWISAQEN
ncbi:MAG: PASTA domain-containing protein [Algoriphagus sp.]|uniref:PASTA domain-containing protein n=1 Tax=Algoriphagus sp. TaxID=1872435 RepID=UPI0017FAC407|nr:PASTA domain-containing protein [Algoriphagus sp.]NVJ87094.1 PASTA domain-containing protein [Algoriphagus sp.]